MLKQFFRTSQHRTRTPARPGATAKRQPAVNGSLLCGLVVLGLYAVHTPGAMAEPLKKNPVVGVFTVTPLADAMEAESGFIESGAGFFFADGTAAGFDQIVISPQTQVPLDEIEEFLGQEGVLPLAPDLTVEFSSWELRDDDTVSISGITSGTSAAGLQLLTDIFGSPDPYVGPILSGFIFSADPVERDLNRNDIPDHVEYIATQPSEGLIGDALDFLVSQGQLSNGQARVIELSMIEHPSVSAVPEPSSLPLVLLGALAPLGARRRRVK